jgi:hypothetical protein
MNGLETSTSLCSFTLNVRGCVLDVCWGSIFVDVDREGVLWQEIGPRGTEYFVIQPLSISSGEFIEKPLVRFGRDRTKP